ncbi:MAG: hypothetical protein DMH00_03500 [Acidobacteria bacterium]|nr:MAG: hypothetical protein DMH00_03500 [Acidobacteriota bacterium]
MGPNPTAPLSSEALPPGFCVISGAGRAWWILRRNSPLQGDTGLWEEWIRGADGNLLDVPGGRGPVHLLNPKGAGPAVLRPYRHGGMLGPLLGNRFLGAQRFLSEIRVSEVIRLAGVATPEILALYIRGASRPIFRGWILTRHVPGSINLRQWVSGGLPGGDERGKVLRLTAQAVRSLHAVGCTHRDLNLSNLLLAPDRVFVLDLDGARLRSALTPRERCANLLRLYRSLAKETGVVEPLSLRDRRAFLKVYACGNSELFRDLWRDLRSRWALATLRRNLSRRRRR